MPASTSTAAAHGPAGGATTKGYRSGTDRLVPPAQTLDRLGPLLRAMGVTRVATVTGLDRIGIPVAFACRPNSRMLAVSQGKALNLDAAKASAVGESIESFHAERIALPVRMSSLAALQATDRAADVWRMPRLTSSRFDPNVVVPWIAGRDLIAGGITYVPYEAVHTDFTTPPHPGSGCFIASTNGLASGNHPLEAISHAICEVIERDATTLWRLRGGETQDRTCVEIASVEDPQCREALARFDDAGVDVAAWDATSDIGVPSFVCRIAERSTDPDRLLYDAEGMGCHPRREIALLRAFTEAAQSRLTVIAGSRDDVSRDEYAELRHPDALRAGRELIAAARPARRFDAVATRELPSFEEDVAWELERLVAAGVHEVVAVDLSLPAFGIPVWRVVIPGLEDMVSAGASSVGYLPGARAQAAQRAAAATGRPGRALGGDPPGQKETGARSCAEVWQEAG